MITIWVDTEVNNAKEISLKLFDYLASIFEGPIALIESHNDKSPGFWIETTNKLNLGKDDKLVKEIQNTQAIDGEIIHCKVCGKEMYDYSTGVRVCSDLCLEAIFNKHKKGEL